MTDGKVYNIECRECGALNKVCLTSSGGIIRWNGITRGALDWPPKLETKERKGEPYPIREVKDGRVLLTFPTPTGGEMVWDIGCSSDCDPADCRCCP